MKYANCFIPNYAVGDKEYSPWTITHKDPAMLYPEVIQDHWSDFKEKNDLDDPDMLDQFYGYLAKKGYGVYQHHSDPVILEID